MEEKDDKTLPVSYSDAEKAQEISFSSRFKNLKFLGEGGSGRVYKAHDTVLNEYVAIKLISKNNLSKEAKERIIREVRVARKLSHPNLVRYYDINEDKDYLIIIMEYIEGASIDRKLRKEGPFKEEELKRILLSLVEAIKYIHSNGIIHRDIKPANIFITEKGEIKLGDFGIIHLKNPEEKLTKTEQAIGTPTYMSPEQITGKEIDEKSDWYSLGITIYEMIQGDVPFSGTIGEIIKGHFEKEIPEVESSKVFNKLVKGLTIKNPKKRWGYEEVIKYLEGKKLPLLPKQKRAFIFFSVFFLVLLLFAFIFLKILRFEPTYIDFNAKNLKVYSKNRLLFKKEMDKEISNVKVVKSKKEKEILISYKIKPEYLTKDPINYIKVGEVLSRKGEIKSAVKVQEMVLSNFQFSLNYESLIFPFNIIKEGKIIDKNYYIKIFHKFYPCIISFFPKGEKEYYPIIHSGHIEEICEWEDRIVAVGFNNVLFHQAFIGLFEKKHLVQLLFDHPGVLSNIISYHLLGYNASITLTEFLLENDKLKIKFPGTDESFILKRNGDLEGFKEGSGELTREFLESYNDLIYLFDKENYQKAKEIIEEKLKISEIFGLYGWTIVFASLLSELKYFQGEKEGAVDICLEYARKYEKYGFDLNNKGALLAYLSGDYKRATNIWQSKLYGEGFRAAEVEIYPVFSKILQEDWKNLDEILVSKNFSKEGIWFKYLKYLKGISYLMQKDLISAIEILRESLNDIEQEDNACFYFLAKYIAGEPDLENYEKFIKNYFTGPLHLQFSGACTKGEWDKAKILYKAMEKEATRNSGISLVFPLIKKVIEKYPEKFNFLQETH